MCVLSVVECGNLSVSEPGPGGLTVNQMTNLFNTTSTYSCQTTGYEISGNAMRTCQANGTYDGMEPNCTCESMLTRPAHINVVCTSPKYAH